MKYQYQLAIGLTQKIVRHYYNNVKYLVKDVKDYVKDKSHLEKALEATKKW
jgi:predicted solute-binding protein